MLKRLMPIIICVLIIAYFVFAVFFLNPRANQDVICQEMRIEIVDTLDRHYLTAGDIEQLLKRDPLNPVGKPVSEIETEAIKQRLEENRLIKKVDCFKSVEGNIVIKVHQRHPILRIFANNKNYYIDNEGEVMPLPRNFAAYVPIASGHITEEFARTGLYEFVLFLQKDKFWNAQIEQIYVNSQREIELTPRVGSHKIVLGELDDYKTKLDNLRLFYDKALNNIGWNRYSMINLKFKNQVVCTKAVK